MSTPSLAVGQKIELNDGRTAIVRFVGATSFQTGDWIGVELEEATGKNDGSVKGERYFDCEQGYGMFLRPAGVRQVLESSKSPKSHARPTGNGVNGKTRPTSLGAGVNGLKRQSLQSGTRAGRESILGASPSPAPRSGLAGLRSPTKQLGTNGTSSAATSRTGTPPTTARKPTTTAAGAKSRPSLAAPVSRRTSTVPSAPSAAPSRTARPSLAGPVGSARVPPGRTAASRAPPSSARPVPGARAGLSNRLSSATTSQGIEDDVSGRSDLLSPKESNDSSAPSLPEASTEEEEEQEEEKPSFAPPPIPPDPPERQTRSRRPSSPAPSTHSGRTIRSSAASAKQIEELEAKVRLLERKRQEDRGVKNDLERTQQERDKYQNIIQKLQTKYQPLQRENEDMKKQLAESEKRFTDIDAIQAEHDSIMEMATLDREMAEETAEGLKAELDALRSKNEEMELELEVLREENGELGKEMSPEERTSTGWLQMEKSNERLREALLRLRDVTQDQEAELKEEIQSLEAQVKVLEGVQGQFEETREKLLRNEAGAEDLRQQLEAALGAEDMIEELSERNMTLQERLEDLRNTIADLEDLRDLNDELEINHQENEKQMQDEIDFKDSLLHDRERTAKQQQEALDDADYTISRFRELVSQLQNDLQDMQASKQISDSEAVNLQSKSRAMIDLNMKLQSSAAKTQVKTIDLELRKLEAQEASEHLAIVQLFLPEAFHSERDSVLALLRFKRISFKANLVNSFVKERVASFGTRGQDENVFAACDALDKLTWIAAMAERFVNAICGCTVEEFAGFESTLYELEPVERALNSYVDALRRDNIRENDMAEELQRSVAVMKHLASLHVKDDLASHADDLLMRTLCLQSQLESTASALNLLKGLVENGLPLPEDDDEDDDGSVSDRALILNRADALITHARNAKVMAQKTYRSLGDLLDRSLTLDESSTGSSDPFDGAESVIRTIAAYTRRAGTDLQALFGDEGRSDPYVPSEVASVLSRSAVDVFQLPAPDAGPFNSLAARLRDLTEMLIDLAALPTDLDNTIEFERAPAPWVARANELKQTKITSIDTEAELARALEKIRERDVILREKETELEEQTVRIEMLEARMKAASKRSAQIGELERDLHKAKDDERKARNELAHAKREAQHDIDRVREEMGRLAEQRAREGSGINLDDNAMGAIAKLTMKRQEHTIVSLQGAVRHLSDENHRLRLPPPDAPHSLQSSLDWLHTPLIKPKTERRKQQDSLQKEGKDILHDLLRLATRTQIADLSKLPENKLAWRPAKESNRWKVEKRKEEWEGWRSWRSDVLRQASQTPPKRYATVPMTVVQPVAGKIEADTSADVVKVVDPDSAELSSPASYTSA